MSVIEKHRILKNINVCGERKRERERERERERGRQSNNGFGTSCRCINSFRIFSFKDRKRIVSIV